MFIVLAGKKFSGKTRYIKRHLLQNKYDDVYVIYLADVENKYTEYLNYCDHILIKIPFFMYLDKTFHDNSQHKKRCIIFENFFFLNIKKEIHKHIHDLLCFLKCEQNIDVFIVMREIYNDIPEYILNLADLIKFVQ